MKSKCIVLILIVSWLALGCVRNLESNSPSQTETNDVFKVETAIEYHSDEVGVHRMDIRFPRVCSNVSGAEILNDMLKTDFPLVREEPLDNWYTEEGYQYTWYRIDYSVSHIEV